MGTYRRRIRLSHHLCVLRHGPACVAIIIDGKWLAWCLLLGWKADGCDIGWAESAGFEFLINAINPLLLDHSHTWLYGTTGGLLKDAGKAGAATNQQICPLSAFTTPLLSPAQTFTAGTSPASSTPLMVPLVVFTLQIPSCSPQYQYRLNFCHILSTSMHLSLPPSSNSLLLETLHVLPKPLRSSHCTRDYIDHECRAQPKDTTTSFHKWHHMTVGY